MTKTIQEIAGGMDEVREAIPTREMEIRRLMTLATELGMTARRAIASLENTVQMIGSLSAIDPPAPSRQDWDDIEKLASAETRQPST